MNSSLSDLKGEFVRFRDELHNGNIFTYAVMKVNNNLYDYLVKINGKALA